MRAFGEPPAERLALKEMAVNDQTRAAAHRHPGAGPIEHLFHAA
jgi:hypothetical protein